MNYTEANSALYDTNNKQHTCSCSTGHCGQLWTQELLTLYELWKLNSCISMTSLMTQSATCFSGKGKSDVLAIVQNVNDRFLLSAI